MHHVFLRIDSVKKPLDQPYEGPYLILERVSNYRIDVKCQPTDVSIDRLKPAFLENIGRSTRPTGSIDFVPEQC